MKFYKKSRASDTGGGVAILFKYNIKTVMLQTFPSFEHITCSFLTNLDLICSVTLFFDYLFCYHSTFLGCLLKRYLMQLRRALS